MSAIAAEKHLARRTVERGSNGERTKDLLFRSSLLLCLLVAVAFLGALAITTLSDGVGRLSTGFLTGEPSRLRTDSFGVRPALIGTL